MFMSHDSDERRMPALAGESGQRYWRSMGLALEGHWFVVTRLERDCDLALRQTSLVSWGADLIRVLMTCRDVISVQRMAPVSTAYAAWAPRSITSVWGVRDQPGVVVMRCEGLDGFVDEFLEPATDPMTGLIQLFPCEPVAIV